MFSAVPFHNLNQYRVLIMNRPFAIAIAVVFSVSAIPAHAGINFAKSSFRATTTFRPTPTRPVMVQRPIVVQRPVIVQQQQSKPRSSNIGLGHVAAAAGVAGLVGYMAGHSSTPASVPVQQQAYQQAQYAQQTGNAVFTPSAPGNKIITCEVVNGSLCRYSNGVFNSNVSVSEYVANSGYKHVVSQSVSFQNGKQFFIIEVN